MRRIAGIVDTSVVVMLAAACGTAGPGTESGGGKEGSDIQVWAIQDAAVNPIATSSIGAYNRSTGNKVKLVTYVNDAYKQKLQVAMGSPQAPDVFFVGIALSVVVVRSTGYHRMASDREDA